MQDKFRQEFNQQYKNNDSKEGEVTIEIKRNLLIQKQIE